MTDLSDVSLTVNGTPHRMHVEPRRLLVHCSREELGLAGTHVGCETAECGTCVVLLNGQAIRSCNLLAVQADGATVSTIEGLAHDAQLHPQTTIACRLEPTPYGTLVTVRDEGFIGRAQAAHGNAEIWERVLGWLDAYLSSRQET